MSEDASSLTPLERRAKVEKETKEEIEKLKQDLQKAKEETQKYKDTHTKPIDPRKDLEPKPSKGEIIVNVKEGKFLLACDVGGTSDPFLVISLKDRDRKVIDSAKSPVVKKTLHPQFNFEHKFKIEDNCLAKSLHIEVFDKDLIGKDFMGSIVINLDDRFWKSDCKEHDPLGFTKPVKHTDTNLKIKCKPHGCLAMWVVYESDEMQKKLVPYFEEKGVYDKEWSAVYSVEYDLEKKIRKLQEELDHHPLDGKLIDAVLDKKTYKVKELLAEGADPKCTSKHTGTSVIKMAAEKKSVEILLLLREAGANLGEVPMLYDDFLRYHPTRQEREAWDADPYLKLLRETKEGAQKAAAEERARKEMEDKKYHYCLVTGKTGYEDDFPHHMFEVKK